MYLPLEAYVAVGTQIEKVALQTQLPDFRIISYVVVFPGISFNVNYSFSLLSIPLVLNVNGIMSTATRLVYEKLLLLSLTKESMMLVIIYHHTLSFNLSFTVMKTYLNNFKFQNNVQVTSFRAKCDAEIASEFNLKTVSVTPEKS